MARYAAQELNTKRIARGVKREKARKKKPDPFKVGFLAAVAIMESQGKSIWQNFASLRKIAKEYRRQLRDR